MEKRRRSSSTIQRIQQQNLFLVFHFLLTCVSNTSSQQQQQQYVSSNDNCFTAVRNAQGVVTLEKCAYQAQAVNADTISYQLNKALANAWEEYGPNSKYQVTKYTPVSTAKSNEYESKKLTSRDALAAYSNGNGNGGQYLGYGPAPPGIPAKVHFQPMTSEWDEKIRPFPLRSRDPMEPSLFSQILGRYVGFEVNHHEIADFMRLVGFGFLVGVIIVGWVILGFFVGFLPIAWLLKEGRSGEAGKDIPALSVVNERNNNNDILKSITERVLLALDGDWLRKLEEKVKLGNENGRWLKTHVHCCILPDDKAQGIADCELVRKARKVSTFKCLSDLIYNFQFGPNNNLTAEETEINDSNAESVDDVDNKKKELVSQF